MCRFDNLKASTIADLMERGFHLEERASLINGSMLPIDKYHDYNFPCFVYKSGSIANFREIIITGCSYDSDAEDYILSICVHKFAESGEWYVDSESLVYKHVPESKLAEFFRSQYLYNRAERQQKEEERKAKLRAAKEAREREKRD